VIWSNRVDGTLAANRLTTTLAALRSGGRPIIDLTLSNPTIADVEYPPGLLNALASARGLVYRPEPFGLRKAREAVAADYDRRGVSVSASRIVLTASTSEAYSLLFKVLCDPGTDILVPRPSYPLLDHLARLDALQPRFYDLEYHHRWSIDFASLERAVTPAVRAIVVVSPNNPTGSRIGWDELDRLDRFAFEHDAALIVDEVFVDYDLTGGAGTEPGVPLRAESSSLVFSLGGLSKSIGLPQAKLAWIAAGGPPTIVDEALARLEFAADAYLSVSTPVQEAAADLLHAGRGIRDQIQERVASNYRHLVRSVPQESGCTTLHAEGGWYGVVRVPEIASEEDLVLSLLEGDGVLTHPGYFFDFQRGAHIVVSLLPAPGPFREGIARLIRHFACTPGGA
jgi:aspartate/methionine/tyrosine aminotransferase